MRSKPWPITRYERISNVCGLLVAVISVAALAGWFAGYTRLKGLRPAFIPMAPNTALLCVVLGVSLAAFRSKSKRFLLAARSTAVVAAALSATRLSEYLANLELKVDHWFFSFPSES